MNMFTTMSASNCEKIHCLYDDASGMKAIIAIHNTKFGPAVGGCRMLPYDTEIDAMEDAIRLAKSMTYKAAMAGIPYGGGKSVIIAPQSIFNRTDYFNAFGQFVDSLKGQYITAIDSGTDMQDMSIVAKITPYVTGYNNQAKNMVNPSFYTAQGVLQGLLAATEYRFASTDLKGKKILIKGAGSVGGYLAEFLFNYGANLYFTDIYIEKAVALAKKFNATVIELDNVLEMKYDIICPCDTSFMVTKNNVDRIKTDIIVGATNNQLEVDTLATELKNRGIIYCPDYVVNSGGLIYVTKLYEHASTTNINQKINELYLTTFKVIQKSENDGISTKLAADQFAQERLNMDEVPEN